MASWPTACSTSRPTWATSGLGGDVIFARPSAEADSSPRWFPPSDTVVANGAQLRNTFDEERRAVSTDPCYSDDRTDFAEDCLAPVQERAWSSPDFLDQPGR